MAQRKSPSDRQTGAASPAPLSWMHRTAPYAPERRARMLEHMARARSLPQPQAATATPPRTSGMDIFGDAFGYTVLFGIIALLFQSRVPLYLGAFLFLTDGERIERALGTIGIRFEPDTVGPDIIKGFDQGLRIPVRMVRAARVPARLCAGLACGMDAAGRILVRHCRHRRRVRDRRSVCGAGDAARIAVVRIPDQTGQPDRDDDQAPHGPWPARLAGAARISLSGTQ
ncbi:hypothetical protein ABIF79_003447 [Bradyrhizobium japonicum]